MTMPETHLRFDGDTFDPILDAPRLEKQIDRVYAAVRHGGWMSLREVAQATGDPETSVSARLRDLRKDRFGGHDIQRRRRARGLWEYRCAGAQALPGVLFREVE